MLFLFFCKLDTPFADGACLAKDIKLDSYLLFLSRLLNVIYKEWTALINLDHIYVHLYMLTF